MTTPPTTPAPTPECDALEQDFWEQFESDPAFKDVQIRTEHMAPVFDTVRGIERERDEARATLARSEQRIEDITCDYRMAKSDLDAAKAEIKRQGVDNLSLIGQLAEAKAENKRLREALE